MMVSLAAGRGSCLKWKSRCFITSKENHMCKMSIKRTIGAVLTGAAALLFGAGQVKADIAPGTCTAGSNGSDAVPQASSPGPFAVGQLMGYRVLLTNPTLDQFGSPGCLISNAFVNLRMPSGEIIPVLTNIVL